VRKPEFQKILRIKGALFIRGAFRRSKILDPGSVEYVVPSDFLVSLVFCDPITTGSTYKGTNRAWFGEGPELAVLRMLGLFDRPADEKALGALLNPPAIRGLTESMANVSPAEWRTILAKLRRARLVSGEDPQNPGQLDAHPLVSEYFGEQLRSQRSEAWKEFNRRLFHYYPTLAPQLPDSFKDMEPLSLAVICGCHAGLFREALHEVYLPRIQRGNGSFAANVLGVRGPLLSVLVQFFEHGRWGSLVETAVGRLESHCGRSALHPHAGGALSNGRARTGITGGTNLLRTRRALVSLA
jgi:hypothetical protein